MKMLMVMSEAGSLRAPSALENPAADLLMQRFSKESLANKLRHDAEGSDRASSSGAQRGKAIHP